MVWAANISSDPAMIATANWARCTTFMATGDYRLGLRLLSDTRNFLVRELNDDDRDVLSVYGGLHLREGVMAARSGDSDAAWSHLDEARECVRRGASDANDPYQLTCAPINSAIVAVAVAVELGDADEAIRRSQCVHIPRGFPAVRASHHHIDLARAHLWKGDRRRALESLLRAEQYAPQQIRHCTRGGTCARHPLGGFATSRPAPTRQ